ncbi:hypothetical protein ACS0TY_014520 [Phlomoides rotata]
MSLNVKENEVREWSSILNCKRSNFPFKYLGLQVGENVKKTACWDFLLTKIDNRLRCWENKQMSLGGRIVLINSVLSNLSSYALAFCRLPNLTLKKINRLVRRFLWDDGLGKERRIAWVGWDIICREKIRGGMGIKNIDWHNLALFGKWGWRVLSDRKSLVSVILDSKYGNFWDCCEFYRESSKGRQNWSLWWSLLIKHIGSKSWFVENASIIVGNGKHTKFWTDNWIGGSNLKTLFPRLCRLDTDPYCSVADRYSGQGDQRRFVGSWRRPILSRDEEQVCKVIEEADRFFKGSDTEDCWKWLANKEDTYSVSSTYLVIRDSFPDSYANLEDLKLAWNKLVPKKVAAFCWKLLQDKIPTLANLIKREAFNKKISRRCRFCIHSEEDSKHLFFECGHARKIWNKVCGWLGHYSIHSSESSQHLEDFSNIFTGERKSIGNAIWQNTVWNIWLNRNSAVFEGTTKSIEEILDRIWISTYAWFRNKDILCNSICVSDWIRAPESCLI